MLGPDAAKEIEVPPSDNKIARRIDDMSADIESIVLENMRISGKRCASGKKFHYSLMGQRISVAMLSFWPMCVLWTDTPSEKASGFIRHCRKEEKKNRR